MWKLSNLFILFFGLCFFIKQVSAETNGVRSIFVQENKLETIFLFPGRASLLSLPCPVTKALIGSPDDIKAEVDKLNTTDIHLLLKKWKSQPSNLILKCKNRVFLFSLIPTKTKHYDYIKVLGHISPNPLKVKSALPHTPLTPNGGLKEKDFKIRKILDFSWRNEK